MVTFKEIAEVKPQKEPKPKVVVKTVTKKESSGGMHLSPGDNKKYVSHALSAWDLPKINTKDDKQVEERIKMYFDYCQENDIRPQLIGMANWLGVTRSTLSKWRNGQLGDHTKSMEKAYMVLESLWADYMMNGKINPVSGIFIAKTWYGYKEQTDIVVTPGRTEEVSDDALIAEAKLISQNDTTIVDMKPID